MSGAADITRSPVFDAVHGGWVTDNSPLDAIGSIRSDSTAGRTHPSAPGLAVERRSDAAAGRGRGVAPQRRCKPKIFGASCTFAHNKIRTAMIVLCCLVE